MLASESPTFGITVNDPTFFCAETFNTKKANKDKKKKELSKRQKLMENGIL